MSRHFCLLFSFLTVCPQLWGQTDGELNWMPREHAREVLLTKQFGPDSQIVAGLSLGGKFHMMMPDSAIYWMEQVKELIDEHPQPLYKAWYEFYYGNSLFFDHGNDRSKTVPYMKRAAQYFDEAGFPMGVSTSLSRLGKTFFFMQQVDSTVYYYQQALAIAQEHGSPEQRINAYQLLVEFYAQVGAFEQGQPFVDSLEKYLPSIENALVRASCHGMLGQFYLHKKDLSDALRHCSTSRYWADSIGHERLLFSALFNEGTTYNMLAFQDSAISSLLRSLSLAEKIPLTQYLPRIKLTLSAIYARAKETDLSKKYKQEALAIADAQGPREKVAFLLEGASTSLEQGDEAGYERFAEGIRENKIAEDTTFWLTVDFFQGLSTLIFDQDPQSALIAFQQIDNAPPELPRMFAVEEMYLRMAECHLLMKQPEEALKLGDKVEELFLETMEAKISRNLAMVRMMAYQQLGEVALGAEAFADHEAALQNEMDARHAISIQMAETRYRTNIIREERDLQAIEADLASQRATQNFWLAVLGAAGLLVFGILAFFLYRSREKQKSLTQEVAQQRDTQIQLTEEVATQRDKNETLLRELNHRVKNNLQQISGLLMLQGRRTSNQETKAALDVSRQRMEALSLLHTLLYKGSEVGEINLRDYLQTLTMNLVRAYGYDPQSISLDMSVADLNVDVDKGVALGLIANEWITNALKYAFPHQSFLKVELQLLEADRACLIIEDRGPGLPEDLNPEEADSYGLRLVNTMCENMYGKVSVNSQTGTQWKLEFSLKSEEPVPSLKSF
ncbi:MAG: sensor histidine kinase [Bacteroidota bacterium]